MSSVVEFPRQSRLRQEETALINRLQTGVNFSFSEGHVELRATHGVVVMKRGRRLGVWVRLEGAFHYLPLLAGTSKTTDDVEVAYQHSLLVVLEAA